MSYIKSATIINSKKVYALLNYEEIITYYKLPFYKKWFKSAPIKEMMEIKPSEFILDGFLDESMTIKDSYEID